MAKRKETVVANPAAPEIYADGVSSVSIRRNVARVTLVSERAVSDLGDAEQVAVGYVSMSLAGFLNLYSRMDSVVQQLRDAGRVTAAEAAPAAGTRRPGRRKTAAKSTKRARK